MTAFPNAALDERTGFLGTTGSGKTYAAMQTAERNMDRGGRIVFIDPLGVTWGLRLLADGKTPSDYRIVIFGGAHGDLPLTPASGAIIGATVATMAESAIIDLSQFKTAAEERVFMRAFLDALYRTSTGANPAHIYFDEADLWAPERIMDKEGGATQLHGLVQTVVRRGRIRGLTSSLISQRPASVSKQILSMVDGLAAFKLTSPHDRNALMAWVSGQVGSPKEAKEILDGLAAKANGQCLLWLPLHGPVIPDYRFPERKTFDSSRTPKAGEKKRKVDLAPLDVSALSERLKTVEQEAAASDPAKLRARIAELERAAKKAPAPVPASADALKAAEDMGYAKGATAAHNAVLDAYRVAKSTASSVMKSAVTDYEQKLWDAIVSPPKMPKPAGKPVGAFSAPPGPGARPEAPKPTPAQPRQPREAISGNGSLAPADVRLLEALAFWSGLGFAQPSREQVAAAAGVSPNSSGFANRLGSLRSAGFIDYPGGGLVTLTDAGLAHAPAPDASQTARDRLGRILAPADAAVVDALAAGPLSREALAEAIGASPLSSGYANRLGALRTLGVIDYPSRGTVERAAWVSL